MECEISSYHIDSFNYLADTGIRLAAKDIRPVKFRLPNGDAVEFSYLDAQLGYPELVSKVCISTFDFE